MISRLQQIHIIATDIDVTAKELSSLYEISLEPFSPHFQKLLNEYQFEFEKYNLDEIVVGAIAPLVRRMITTWKPLEDPTFLLPTFRSWRNALRISPSSLRVEMQVDKFGSATTVTKILDSYVAFIPYQDLGTHPLLQGKANDAVRKPLMEHMAPQRPVCSEQRLVPSKPAASFETIRGLVIFPPHIYPRQYPRPTDLAKDSESRHRLELQEIKSTSAGHCISMASLCRIEVGGCRW